MFLSKLHKLSDIDPLLKREISFRKKISKGLFEGTNQKPFNAVFHYTWEKPKKTKNKNKNEIPCQSDQVLNSSVLTYEFLMTSWEATLVEFLAILLLCTCLQFHSLDQLSAVHNQNIDLGLRFHSVIQ